MARALAPIRIVPDAPRDPRPTDRAHVSIYRPFFLSGMASVLTAGCLLGAIALLGIAFKGSFTAPEWTPYVWAHANSQLFGWIGLFVIGFSLQQHAPSVARSGAFHRLARWSLGLMAAGILLRFGAEPLARVDRGVGLPLGVVACLMQVVAVALFFANTTVNRHRTGERLPWSAALVFGSLFWLAVVAAAEPFVFLASHQSDPDASLAFVARWFGPLREAQFLGFASTMVFAVASSKFSSCLGFAPPHRGLALLGFAAWTLGLGARIGGWLHTHGTGFAAGSETVYRWGGVLLAMGAVAVAASLRLYEERREQNPSQKFLRAAFGWLLFAGLLLVLEPIHLGSLGAPFSHAYTGAIRHAVTVGFLSQMIVGVALHVVTRINGLPHGAIGPLWSVFILLNLGNAARVGLEVATDFTPAAFAPMGATGFVELAGLAIWATALARAMWRRRGLVAGTC